MPATLGNTTVADTYPSSGASQGAQLGMSGLDVFTAGWFFVANNAVFMEYMRGIQGQQTLQSELYITPGYYPITGGTSPNLGPVGGFRFRNAVAGQVAQVSGVLFYPGEAQIGTGQPFTGTVSAGGSVTPPAGSFVTTGNYAAGPIAPGPLLSVGAPAAGTYIVGFGAGTWNSGGLGDSGTITSNVTGAAQTRLATTAGSGNGVWKNGIVLTNGQTVTLTGTNSGTGSFSDVWVVLIQTA